MDAQLDFAPPDFAICQKALRLVYYDLIFTIQVDKLRYLLLHACSIFFCKSLSISQPEVCDYFFRVKRLFAIYMILCAESSITRTE